MPTAMCVCADCAVRIPGPSLTGRSSSLLQADVDLRDLQLARRAARDLDGARLVALVSDQRAADRRLVGELRLLRLRLGRAHDRVLDRLARLFVLDVDDRADLHYVSREVLRLDHARHPQLLLQLRDAALEHRLLVLRVVVLRVLRDVAELARLLDPLGDLATLLRREQLELVFELLQSFRGEDYVLRHWPSIACCSWAVE